MNIPEQRGVQHSKVKCPEGRTEEPVDGHRREALSGPTHTPERSPATNTTDGSNTGDFRSGQMH